MIPHYSNQVLISLYLWAENRLLNQSQAYVTRTCKLFPMPNDPVLGNQYTVYSSPFKQWVYDQGVSGAQIISGISGSSGLWERGDHGLKFDYENGRVLLDSGLGTGLDLTGTFSFKEVNFYLTNETQDALISTAKNFINPKYSTAPLSGVKPYSFNAPAIFVSDLKSTSKPWAFGGMQLSEDWLSLTVFAESSFQLTNILGVFRDSAYQHIPILQISDDPMNEWGDMKYDTFDYGKYCVDKGTPGNLIYIEQVHASKISSSVRSNQALYCGIIDLKLVYPRMPTPSAVGESLKRLAAYSPSGPFFIIGENV